MAFTGVGWCLVAPVCYLPNPFGSAALFADNEGSIWVAIGVKYCAYNCGPLIELFASARAATTPLITKPIPSVVVVLRCMQQCSSKRSGYLQLCVGTFRLLWGVHYKSG